MPITLQTICSTILNTRFETRFIVNLHELYDAIDTASWHSRQSHAIDRLESVMEVSCSNNLKYEYLVVKILLMEKWIVVLYGMGALVKLYEE